MTWLVLRLAILRTLHEKTAESSDIQSTLTQHILADVRDLPKLCAAMRAAAPEIVLHLAAQPLVRLSYREPVQTWSTNVMGTVNLLEAVRACPSVKAVLVVTTDKCYQNQERLTGYQEHEPLGGNDPYSASKAATELVVQSYRNSYFSTDGPFLASARAGNVIGGGDWCADRLIPDAVRAISTGTPILIRHPNATRPWQHVLEALHGYLLLSARLFNADQACASAFNFGPDARDNVAVGTVLTHIQRLWPELDVQIQGQSANQAKEAQLLYLDSSKAQKILAWSAKWELAQALDQTIAWYQTVLADPQQARAISEQQLANFCAQDKEGKQG